MNTQKTWLTLNERALLSAQYDVQLEEQLGDALQERLQQSEHAQIGSQTKQGVVLMFCLFRWIFCSPPGQPEPSLQQVIVPVSEMKPILMNIIHQSVSPGGRWEPPVNQENHPRTQRTCSVGWEQKACCCDVPQSWNAVRHVCTFCNTAHSYFASFNITEIHRFSLLVPYLRTMHTPSRCSAVSPRLDTPGEVAFVSAVIRPRLMSSKYQAELKICVTSSPTTINSSVSVACTKCFSWKYLNTRAESVQMSAMYMISPTKPSNHRRLVNRLILKEQFLGLALWFLVLKAGLWKRVGSFVMIFHRTTMWWKSNLEF